MKRKVPFPIRKRYKEGMRTCVILMVIILIITVGASLLTGYVGRQKPDTASFVRTDEMKGFSVPYYNCPVEIELNIVGGGNATFYLVKGDLIRHNERNYNPRTDPESAEYISSHRISWKENARSYYFDGDLDKGDYTLLVFRLQEKKNDSKPLIVGIDVEEGSKVNPNAMEYTSSSKVVYEQLNVFVLKPLLPFIWITFLVGELFLVLWLVLFVRKWKDEKKYAGARYPTPKTSKDSHESPTRARPSWETDKSHRARKNVHRSGAEMYAGDMRGARTGKHISSSSHHTQRTKQKKRDASHHAARSQHLADVSSQSAPEKIQMVKVGEVQSSPEKIQMVKVGGGQATHEQIPMVKVGEEKEIATSSAETSEVTVLAGEKTVSTTAAEESPASIPYVPIVTKETIPAVQEQQSRRESEISGKEKEIKLEEITSIDQLMEDITVEDRKRKSGRAKSLRRPPVARGRARHRKGIAERMAVKERISLAADEPQDKKKDDWRRSDLDTKAEVKLSSKRRERLESTFNSILQKNTTHTTTTKKRPESKDVLRNRMDDLLTMVLK